MNAAFSIHKRKAISPWPLLKKNEYKIICAIAQLLAERAFQT
jgi:hypothetical protein